MVLVSNSWRLWLVGMAVSLAIFGVVYFTVIKPSTDTANQAIKSGLQQTQQVLNPAQKQLKGAGGSGAAGSQALSSAQKLGVKRRPARQSLLAGRSAARYLSGLTVSLTLSAASPTLSFTLPVARSTLPSFFRLVSSLRSPAASLTRPFALSTAPSPMLSSLPELIVVWRSTTRSSPRSLGPAGSARVPPEWPTRCS
jgi:hypothetical protein